MHCFSVEVSKSSIAFLFWYVETVSIQILDYNNINVQSSRSPRLRRKLLLKGPTYLITNWRKKFQNQNLFWEIPRTILFHEIAVAFMLLRSCRSMVPSPFVGLLSILRRRFLTEQRTIFHLHDQTNFSLFSELISSIVIKIKIKIQRKRWRFLVFLYFCWMVLL